MVSFLTYQQRLSLLVGGGTRLQHTQITHTWSKASCLSRYDMMAYDFHIPYGATKQCHCICKFVRCIINEFRSQFYPVVSPSRLGACLPLNPFEPLVVDEGGMRLPRTNVGFACCNMSCCEFWAQIRDACNISLLPAEQRRNTGNLAQPHKQQSAAVQRKQSQVGSGEIDGAAGTPLPATASQHATSRSIVSFCPLPEK